MPSLSFSSQSPQFWLCLNGGFSIVVTTVCTQGSKCHLDIETNTSIENLFKTRTDRNFLERRPSITKPKNTWTRLRPGTSLRLMSGCIDICAEPMSTWRLRNCLIYDSMTGEPRGQKWNTLKQSKVFLYCTVLHSPIMCKRYSNVMTNR